MRFLVVLTAAAGLLTLFTPPCTDGMSVMPAASAGSPTSMVSAVKDAQPVTAQAAASVGGHAMSSPAEPCGHGSGSTVLPTAFSIPSHPIGPVGTALTCVLLVAVLVAMAGSWRRWRPGSARPPQPPPLLLCPAPSTRFTRRPTLTQLCVLRI